MKSNEIYEIEYGKLVSKTQDMSLEKMYYLKTTTHLLPSDWMKLKIYQSKGYSEEYITRIEYARRFEILSKKLTKEWQSSGKDASLEEYTSNILTIMELSYKGLIASMNEMKDDNDPFAHEREDSYINMEKLYYLKDKTILLPNEIMELEKKEKQEKDEADIIKYEVDCRIDRLGNKLYKMWKDAEDTKNVSLEQFTHRVVNYESQKVKKLFNKLRFENKKYKAFMNDNARFNKKDNETEIDLGYRL